MSEQEIPSGVRISPEIPNDIWGYLIHKWLCDEKQAYRIYKFLQGSKSLKCMVEAHLRKPTNRLLYERSVAKYRKPIFSPAFLTADDKIDEWISIEKNREKWLFLDDLFYYAENGNIPSLLANLKTYKGKYQNKSLYDLLHNTFNYYGISLYASIPLVQRQKVLDFLYKIEPDHVPKLAFSKPTHPNLYGMSSSSNEYQSSFFREVLRSVKTNNIDQVKRVLGNYSIADVEKQDLLVLSVAYGHHDLFNALFEYFKFESLDCPFYGENDLLLGTLLFKQAVESGTIALFAKALNKYSEFKDDEDNSKKATDALHQAIQRNDLDAVKSLYNLCEEVAPTILTGRYTVNEHSFRSFQDYASYLAMLLKHTEISKFLMEKAGSNLQRSYIQAAIVSNNIEIVKFLLAKHDWKSDLSFVRYLNNSSPEMETLLLEAEEKRVSLIVDLSAYSEYGLKIRKLRTLQDRESSIFEPIKELVKEIKKSFQIHPEPWPGIWQVLKKVGNGVISSLINVLIGGIFSLLFISFWLLLPIGLPFYCLPFFSEGREILADALVFTLQSLSSLALGLMAPLTAACALIRLVRGYSNVFDKAEQTPAIQSLVKDARKELDALVQVKNRQNSYHKLQVLWRKIQAIDQKRRLSIYCKKKNTSVKSEEDYHNKLDPCVQKISSILFLRSPAENCWVAQDIQECKKPIESYLDLFSAPTTPAN